MKKILLAILIISQAGCSSIIYSSGKYYSVVMSSKSKSREQVREKIGEPERTEIKNGSECDIFIVKGMVSDEDKAMQTAMSAAALFIPEIYFFPKSLYDIPGRIRGTHELRAYYSDDGYLVGTYLETIKETQQ
ncbi:MAG: hypothetical protein JXR23_07185 [Pontiellaceae bacterium]|nr:hypothetical protein [Pontiellaceae bacterium]